MRRRRLAVATGIVLLCVAIPLAAVGRALLAVPRGAGSAAGWPGSVQVRPASGGLADRAARAIVGADRDGAFVEVVAVYRKAVALLAAAGDPRGPVAISRLVPKLRSASERAQAQTMAGTLLAYSAGSGLGVILPSDAQAPTAAVLAQALVDFRDAIRSEPGYEPAKYDLELLLRQRRRQTATKPKPAKPRQAPTTQDTRSKTPQGNGAEHHAGIYATGSGY